MTTMQRCVVAALAAVESAGVGMAAEERSSSGKGAPAGVRTATVVVAAADAPEHLNITYRLEREKRAL